MYYSSGCCGPYQAETTFRLERVGEPWDTVSHQLFCVGCLKRHRISAPSANNRLPAQSFVPKEVDLGEISLEGDDR